MNNENCPIQLKPHQVETAKNIWSRLVSDKVFAYMDVSRTGLGKTHIGLFIAWHLQNKYGLKVGLVGSSDQSIYSDDGWFNWSKRYGIKLDVMMTYPQLRAYRGQTHHPFLVYDPDTKEYHASEEFEKMAAQGIFLIFDEFHKSTRKSSTHKACAALVRACKRYRERCRVGLLSFTPGDKDEHYPQILRMLGVISEAKLYHVRPFTSEYNWRDYGLGQLVRICQKLSPNTNFLEHFRGKMNVKRANRICKTLYDDHIRDIVTFAMPKPEVENETTFLNCFLENSPEDLDVINEGLVILRRAVRWRNGDVAAQNEWDMGGITTGLKIIERGKLETMIRYVKSEAKRNPQKKFIMAIGARCVEHQKYVQDRLARRILPDSVYLALRAAWKFSENWKNVNHNVFGLIMKEVVRTMEPVKPRLLNGTVKPNERVKTIADFQSSGSDAWCLIMTPGVGAESISLHDQHGNHPRDILISPDHHFSRVVQTAGRVDRVGVKSNSKVMMVYAKEADEASVLNCMVRKTKVAKDMLVKGQDEIFPAEYPYFIEGNQDQDLIERLEQMRLDE